MVFWFETIFFREKDCFEQPSFEKPSFSREKDGFTRRRPPKTIFFSRKRWFYQDKKPSFPKLWGWGLQKMVFLVFSRKRWLSFRGLSLMHYRVIRF